MPTFTITGTLDNDIGLMYFDPTSQTLKEFDSSVVNIPLYPYDKTIKRFYLCGPILHDSRNLVIEVLTTDSELYNTKVLVGNNRPTKTDFNLASDSFSFNTSILGSVYTNVIPVDVYIESITSTEKTINLEINILEEV